MPPLPKTQNAAKKTPDNNPPRKAEIHPQIIPALKRQDADIKMEETDEDTDEEGDPQPDSNQKAGNYVNRYEHDVRNPFRGILVHERRRDNGR